MTPNLPPYTGKRGSSNPTEAHTAVAAVTIAANAAARLTKRNPSIKRSPSLRARTSPETDATSSNNAIPQAAAVAYAPGLPDAPSDQKYIYMQYTADDTVSTTPMSR